MRSYPIGQVSNLLGVKPHVLRYWEEEIPFLAPRKNRTGRRVYSDREVQLLFRIRHLLYEQRYTLEGARNRLWAELGRPDPGLQLRVGEIRRDLLEAWAIIQKNRGTE